ncbi:hypothetical protein FLA_3809 [Filimonas lacunae]|nr:hypothetical protein FLA_3809 [Filimonas lacunae]
MHKCGNWVCLNDLFTVARAFSSVFAWSEELGAGSKGMSR